MRKKKLKIFGCLILAGAFQSSILSAAVTPENYLTSDSLELKSEHTQASSSEEMHQLSEDSAFLESETTPILLSDVRHDEFNISPDEFSHGHEEGNVQTSDNIIEIYGKVMIALNENRPGNASMLSSGSRLGLRGNKVLENSLLAFWQIESGIDLDNLGSDGHGGNESELASRDTFVGISGNKGTLVFGKHNTPYKMSVHSWDPFNHVAGDFRALLGRIPGFTVDFNHHGSIYHVRAPNSVVFYPKPKNGVSAAFGAAAIDEASENRATFPILSARITVQSNNFEFVFAHETHNRVDYYSDVGHEEDEADISVEPDLVESSHANLFGLYYSWTNTNLFGIAEHISVNDEDLDIQSERVVGLLGIVHNINQISMRLTVGQATEFSHDDGAFFTTVGLFRKLSADTTAYINFASVQNQSEGKYPSFYMEEAESNVSSFSLGFVHSF